MTINFYRMLVLAGMTLLVAVNLSQAAFGSHNSHCIKEYDSADGRVVKYQNICEESWKIRYAYGSAPETVHEQVLRPGTSLTIRFKDDQIEFFALVACPATFNMSSHDTFYNINKVPVCVIAGIEDSDDLEHFLENYFAH